MSVTWAGFITWTWRRDKQVISRAKWLIRKGGKWKIILFGTIKHTDSCPRQTRDAHILSQVYRCKNRSPKKEYCLPNLFILRMAPWALNSRSCGLQKLLCVCSCDWMTFGASFFFFQSIDADIGKDEGGEKKSRWLSRLSGGIPVQFYPYLVLAMWLPTTVFEHLLLWLGVVLVS